MMIREYWLCSESDISFAESPARPHRFALSLTRKLMARMLQRLGHKVTTAENGEVALQMMAERHQPGEWGDQFHIVFLDK
jgi:hypothetical protein